MLRQMIATIATIIAIVALGALLIHQRDRARVRRRLLMRAIEAEARVEAMLSPTPGHATAVQRAVASQFRRT